MSGERGLLVNRSKKLTRGQRADRSCRGLGQFSMKVCKKVESKGTTTYNEVAEELVAEYADARKALGPNDQPQYDEKNIRRRVYDALNVLMAMDIISKDKKEIQWRGLPQTKLSEIEENERVLLKNRIEQKKAYLQELEEQFVGYQNLVQRNQHLYGDGKKPSGGLYVPFILLQTSDNATVELEISEDRQLVHFDFESTPLQLHDDYYVLKQMKFCERQRNVGEPLPVGSAGEAPSMPNTNLIEPSRPSSPSKTDQTRNQISRSPSTTDQPQIPISSSRSNATTKSPTSPPLPGGVGTSVESSDGCSPRREYFTSWM